MNHPTFVPLTTKTWRLPNNDLMQTIENFKKDLNIWNKENFGNVFHNIKRMKAKLNGLQKILGYRNDA